jgi:late competence protein required for DNA uptake (superfamily II DNA/RNA helicase)
MLRFSRYPLIKPEISTLIKDSTNRFLQQRQIEHHLNVHLEPESKNPPNILILLTFVSIFSFLAGYHFRRLTL